MQRLEDTLHRNVASLLSRLIAPPGFESPDGVYWFSIEHRNARSRLEGVLRKARGVIAGIPDIMVCHGQRVFWVELKSPTGRANAAQKAFHVMADNVGQPVGVCRTMGDVIAFLEENAIPLRGEVMA